uniref:Dynein regulatory complex subunit 5-like n=1 Tax=Diabrotica virgifera virgifera TaxID=50390 RepID=A0A6P7FZD2_DIAVI
MFNFKGAVLLNESLSNSQFLTELDLSCNHLGDTGIRNVQQGLCDMPSLKVLNLSNNKLTGEAADAIEKIIVNNRVLSELNLSWNEFYTAVGNRLIFRSLRNTDRLRVLNLSWNGITASNAVSWLCRYIRRSSALEELDLSWNRFSERALNLIKRAVNRSKSLVTVKIGNI